MTRVKKTDSGGDRTILTKANDASYSLRTTVPKGIVNQFVLKEGDFLIWKIIPSSDGKGLAISIEIEKGVKK
jgi:hypothetical protein